MHCTSLAFVAPAVTTPPPPPPPPPFPRFNSGETRMKRGRETRPVKTSVKPKSALSDRCLSLDDVFKLEWSILDEVLEMYKFGIMVSICYISFAHPSFWLQFYIVPIIPNLLLLPLRDLFSPIPYLFKLFTYYTHFVCKLLRFRWRCIGSLGPMFKTINWHKKFTTGYWHWRIYPTSFYFLYKLY